MKKKSISLFLIPVFAYTLYFVVFSGKVAPRHPFEKSVLFDEQNKEVSIKDFKGKVLIITYFQSWCGDCRRELPELAELQRQFGDKLKVIVITDESFDISNQVKEYLKINLPFYKSEKRLKEIGIHRFPTTYLLNKDGKIVTSKVEAKDWGSNETIEQVKELVK